MTSATPESQLCIVTAGRPGNGKSTALNNIFNLGLTTGMSAAGVTKVVEKNCRKVFGVDVVVIDTPGLGDMKIDKNKIVADIREALKGLDYTLLYCINIGPGKRLTRADKSCLAILHEALGKVVWDKSVVLFTFCDKVRTDDNYAGSDKKIAYQKYVKSYASTFYEALKECDPKVPVVKSIFECEGQQYSHKKKVVYNRLENENELIAIPVERSKESVTDVLPDIIPAGRNWTYLAFLELLRKTDEARWEHLLMLKFGELSGAVFGSLMFGGPSALGIQMGHMIGSFLGKTMGQMEISKQTVATFIEMVDAQEEEEKKGINPPKGEKTQKESGPEKEKTFP